MAYILGIDISKEAITTSLIVAKGKKSTIVDCGIVALEKDAFNKEDIFSKKLLQAIENIISEKKIKKAKCIISLPPDLGSYKNIKIPFKGDKKIEQILPNELEPRMIFDPQTSAFAFNSFEINGNNNAKIEESSTVFAAVYNETIINIIESILASFKFKTIAITLGGAYAIALGMLKSKDIEGDGLFVHIGSTNISVCFVVQDQIISFRNFDINNSDVITCAADIARMLIIYKELFSVDIKLSYLVFSGQTKEEQKFKNALHKYLSYVPQFKPFLQNEDIKLKISSDAPWIEQKMDVNHCLALIATANIPCFDFASKPMSFSEYLKENKKNVTRSSLLFFSAIAILMGGFFYDVYNVNNELDSLDNEIKSIFKINFPKVKNIINPVHQMSEKIKEMKKSDDIMMQTGGRVLVVDVLNEVSSSIPKSIDVAIMKMSILKKEIIINGNTNSFNAIDLMKKKLSMNNIFKRVKIGSATMNKRSRRINFRLSLYTK